MSAVDIAGGDAEGERAPFSADGPHIAAQKATSARTRLTCGGPAGRLRVKLRRLPWMSGSKSGHVGAQCLAGDVRRLGVDQDEGEHLRRRAARPPGVHRAALDADV